MGRGKAIKSGMGADEIVEEKEKRDEVEGRSGKPEYPSIKYRREDCSLIGKTVYSKKQGQRFSLARVTEPPSLIRKNDRFFPESNQL